MKFTLEIELGNDAMQTGDEVAAAIADAIAGDEDPVLRSGQGNIIRDSNGNTVGKWEVRED